jgi:hypothetical protein
MIVKFLREENVGGQHYKPGDTLEVPIDQARALVVLKIAEAIESPRYQPVEEAVATPLVETAVKRKYTKRGKK